MRHLHVLVADDGLDNQRLFRAYVTGQPITRDVVENGRLAVGRRQACEHDLAIVDVHMPVLDGYATAVAIRTWERGNGRLPLPIVVLTASDEPEAHARSRAAGCTALLTKPIRRLEFLAAIERHARAPVRLDEVRVPAVLADIIPGYLASRTTSRALVPPTAFQNCPRSAGRSNSRHGKRTASR